MTTLAARWQTIVCASRGNARAFLHAQLRSTGVLFLGTILGGILSYVAMAISARMLGAEDFGLLGAALGLVSMVGVAARPTNIVATHLAARAVSMKSARELRGLASIALMLCVGLGVILVLVSMSELDLLQSFLRIPDLGPVLALAVVVAATIGSLMLTGLVAGQHRFWILATAAVADPLTRALVIFPLVLFLGVTGSLLSYVAGLLATYVVALISVGGIGRTIPSWSQARASAGVAMSSLALTLAVALVQNGDLVLLRSYAAPDEVGQYAAAASIGGLVFILCAPIYIPAFPKTVSAHAEGKPTWPILRDVLLLVTAIGVVMIAGSVWLGSSAAQLLFGPAFSGTGTYLPAYISKIVALVVFYVFGQHALAVGDTRPAYIAAMVGVTGPLLVLILHPGPLSTALIMFAAASAAAIVLFLLLFSQSLSRSRCR
jgi:O-antigen/teichoic acid export membrane protein